MKRILTILALVAFTLPSGVATQQASAQIDKSPGSWSAPEKADTLSADQIRALRDKYRALAAPALPAHVDLPPVKYDGPYRGGQVIVIKWNDYSMIRMICKDTPNPIACSYQTYSGIPDRPIACLIMLGPVAHNSAQVLRHEMGHCNGWASNHEGAR
jgi:hypothetical protein